ncbi:MAG: hypothetical protein AAF989_04610, partial [Planctomycetota bacterium]
SDYIATSHEEARSLQLAFATGSNFRLLTDSSSMSRILIAESQPSVDRRSSRELDRSSRFLSAHGRLARSSISPTFKYHDRCNQDGMVNGAID